MPHPLLGLPPSDVHAGHPAAAARLRAEKARLGRLALDAMLKLDPSFRERYEEHTLRLLLRDYDRHIEQLARALETGEDRFVVMYGEALVPTFRRRGMRMNDVVTVIHGLREAAQSALDAEEAEAMRGYLRAWVERMRRHARLPGDHKGNALVRLIWKGAGLGDDSVV